MACEHPTHPSDCPCRFPHDVRERVEAAFAQLCRFPFEQDETCNRRTGHDGEHAHLNYRATLTSLGGGNRTRDLPENTYVGDLPTFASLRTCRFPFEPERTCNLAWGHMSEHRHDLRTCDTCGGPVEDRISLGSTCDPCLTARMRRDALMGLLRANVEVTARAAGRTPAEVVQDLLGQLGLSVKQHDDERVCDVCGKAYQPSWETCDPCEAFIRKAGAELDAEFPDPRCEARSPSPRDPLHQRCARPAGHIGEHARMALPDEPTTPYHNTCTWRGVMPDNRMDEAIRWDEEREAKRYAKPTTQERIDALATEFYHPAEPICFLRRPPLAAALEVALVARAAADRGENKRQR